MKRTELNRRCFAKAIFLGVSAIVAGIAIGCGGRQTSSSEPQSQPTGSGQTSEDQDSNGDGSSTRDDGSSTRDDGSSSR